MHRFGLAVALLVATGAGFVACIVDIPDVVSPGAEGGADVTVNEGGGDGGSSDAASDAGRDAAVPCGSGGFVALPKPKGAVGAVAISSDRVRTYWVTSQTWISVDRDSDAAAGPNLPGFLQCKAIVSDGNGGAYVADYGDKDGGAGGRVWRIDEDGGTSPIATAPRVIDVALDANDVYYVTIDGDVYALARDGGAPNLLGSVHDAGVATALTADQGSVFAAFNTSKCASNTDGVVRFGPDGGSCGVLSNALVLDVAATGGQVYVESYNTCGLPSAYVRVAESCGSTAMAMPGLGTDGELAVDGKTVYRAVATGVGWTCIDGGATGTIMGPSVAGAALAVDEDYVYAASTSTVYRAPKACCP